MLLTIKQLQVKYGNHTALQIQTPISFEKGERIGIIGSNGAGKTTLVKTLLVMVNYEGSIVTNLAPEEMAAHMQFNEYVTTMPVKYIQRLERDMQTLGGSSRDTVCIDFCSGNDACVLTTIYTALHKRNISLVGGTGDQGRVSANGRVYQDAVAYALVKNQNGRVKTYKENIYHQLGDYRFVASNTDRANYILGALNGKSAKQVYKDILHVTDEEILTRTFQNPFGKVNGDDTCIISIKEVQGNALACFRQVNDSDVLILLELGDYQAITRETIQQICRDFPRRSAIFSINCLFRYKLFSEHNYMQAYLRDMAALGNHAGFVGYGEHYNNRFVNQSMTCVVFE